VRRRCCGAAHPSGHMGLPEGVGGRVADRATGSSIRHGGTRCPRSRGVRIDGRLARRPVGRTNIGEALIDRLALTRPSPTEFVNCPWRSRKRAPAPQPDSAARHGRSSWVAFPRPGAGIHHQVHRGRSQTYAGRAPAQTRYRRTRTSIPGCPTRIGSVCMFSNSCFVQSHTLVRGCARL
jgi:hypothetical protein